MRNVHLIIIAVFALIWRDAATGLGAQATECYKRAKQAQPTASSGHEPCDFQLSRRQVQEMERHPIRKFRSLQGATDLLGSK